MTNGTALYYQRKMEKEERFKKIIGQKNINSLFKSPEKKIENT